MQNKNNEKEKSFEMINLNLTELNKLKNDYKNIWLTYYKPDNLNMIMDKFDFLSAYFTETKSALINNSLINPVIPSKWIYYSTAKDSLQSSAKFTKEFEINDDITSAKMQLLGDSYVKLYINGKFVDEIYARRSLSLLVDYRRIMYKDISSFIKKGKNIIEIEAFNYNKEPNAGLNFISEIKTPNNTLTLISDQNWLVKPIESEKGIKNAEVKEYPFTVIAPNFNTDRTSKSER